jgi:synaptic vesicle membrane protein VAT-1
MRQIWITQLGAPEVLQVRQAADPEAGAEEVRVRVRAAGINFADILARIGIYPDSPKIPAVVGYEVSGEIDQVGSSVKGWKVGDKVIGITRFGGYSDTVVLRPEQLFPLPATMTFSQGAAVPVNYLTTYQMLFAMGSIRKGDKVLVHSAAGGIGLAAIELCRIAGAEVVGIASVGKHPFLRERGVHLLIDSQTKDLLGDVKKLTGGKGVEIILDPVGGKSWSIGFDCLAPTGRLIMFGISSAATGKKRSWVSFAKTLASIPWFKVNPIALINENKALMGVNLGHMWGEREKMREWGNEILKWHAEGKVVPHVDKEFSFDQAAQAHHYIQDRKNIGKVILVP